MTARPPGTRRMLRPGLRLLARGRDAWQLGIDPVTASRVPRDPDVDRVLGLLQDAAPLPDDPAGRRALSRLESHCVDLPEARDEDIDAADHAAVLQRGADVARRLTGRAEARVEIQGSLGPDPTPLLHSAGVHVDGEHPTAGLILSAGEISRDRLDPWVRRGLPHLVVRLLDGAIVLGPFVVPGQTACLRCVDAHLALADPLHHAMVDQHARAWPVARRDGSVEPCDTVLATLAVAWAVRDLVTHAEGDRPTTWSSTIRLDPGLAAVTDVRWLRHPECGCSWDGAVPTSATMAR